MIEVAGTWEYGWSAPKTEFDLWWAVMRTYDIPMLHMTPRSGYQHRMLTEHDTFEELLGATDLTPVFVDENAECDLRDFEHPENALYVFGKANYSPFTNLAAQGLSVRVNAPTLGMLWPHQAFAVVMHDRGQR
jgi:hypothetical protein